MKHFVDGCKRNFHLCDTPYEEKIQIQVSSNENRTLKNPIGVNITSPPPVEEANLATGMMNALEDIYVDENYDPIADFIQHCGPENDFILGRNRQSESNGTLFSTRPSHFQSTHQEFSTLREQHKIKPSPSSEIESDRQNQLDTAKMVYKFMEECVVQLNGLFQTRISGRMCFTSCLSYLDKMSSEIEESKSKFIEKVILTLPCGKNKTMKSWSVKQRFCDLKEFKEC